MVVVVRGGGGARRRNAPAPLMMTPPPRAMSNPRRRRRARRNPRRRVRVRGYSRRNPFDLRMLLDVGLRAGAAAGASYLVNKVFISTLGTDNAGRDTQYGMLMRNAVRVALGAVGVAWVGGTFGTAWAGAMLYPAAYEIDSWWQRQGTTRTAAGSSERRYKTEEELALGSGEGSYKLEAELNAELEAALGGYQSAY